MARGSGVTYRALPLTTRDLRRLITQDVSLRWSLTVALDFLRETAPQEVAADGALKAEKFHESAEIGLREVPVGSIVDVASQPEFSASSISPEEFERTWRTASWSTKNVPGRQ
ncbi:DUF6881 domain-containing protein [Streptomyces cyanogenus]|uniref:DUF6881 domain-containing protein n=1 Tax=Streptomyces cyanogenus TaxID=80860 RepID=UPI003C7E17E6